MFKFFALLGLLACLTGCQTTGTGGSQKQGGAADRTEKLLLRVDQFVGTYEVKVQRAVMTGADPKQRDQWAIVGSSEVEGYPGKFRSSESSAPAENGTKQTFLLDGTSIAVSQEPGTHLIAKVLPVHQNTARVVGVFVHVSPAGTFSMPFDVHCDMGRVYEVYSRELPVSDEVKEISELYTHLD